MGRVDEPTGAGGVRAARGSRARGQWTHLRTVSVAAVLVGVVGAASVVWFVTRSADTATPSTHIPATTRASAAPETPPARVCGDSALLDGPSSPPAGAVAVGTSQDLGKVTDRHPANTTFWLSPGMHRLGTEYYDQVRPKNGNTYIGAPGAILDGQKRNRFAFVGYGENVTIRHLTVQNFGWRGSNSDEGIINHDAGADWLVERNMVRWNAGAGVMLGSRNTLRTNCLRENGQYGFSAYHPSKISDVIVEGNEIAGNNADDWERRRPGCGCSGGGKFWMVTDAVVSGNWVHDNKNVGLWMDTNNAGFSVERNYIADNDAEGIMYEASYNAAIRDNTLVRNGRVRGPHNGAFPTGAIYVSESGSDRRVHTAFADSFEITGNVFEDNWSGVILWENSDRFAGSDANPGMNMSTLVNPGVTARTCNAENIARKPYLDDCRWKTQNVRVHGNEFIFSPRAVGKDCVLTKGCGYNGLFANWGTFPKWSPYQRDAVQDRIAYEQDNLFSANTYAGPWYFLAHGQGNRVNWATWQSAPYSQDTDSVIKPGAEVGRCARDDLADQQCRSSSLRPTGD